MAPLIPNAVPRHFPAGTTVQFSRAFDQYPSAEGWSYTLYLNGVSQKFNKTATVQEDGSFLVTLLPADTAALNAGAYRYAERLSNPGTKFNLVSVAADGANAVYSFASQSGPAPYIGMPVVISGFSNSGNNVTSSIVAMTGSAALGGTITVGNGAAVNETASALAAGPAEAYDLRGDELVLTIEPNVASSAAGVFVSFEEQMLAAIESLLLGRVPADIQSYQVAGRALNKIPVEELAQLRGKYASMVWRKQHPGKLGINYKAEFPMPADNSKFPPTWVDVTGFEV